MQLDRLTHILEYLSNEALGLLFLLRTTSTDMQNIHGSVYSTDVVALSVQHPDPHKYQTTTRMRAGGSY